MNLVSSSVIISFLINFYTVIAIELCELIEEGAGASQKVITVDEGIPPGGKLFTLEIYGNSSEIFIEVNHSLVYLSDQVTREVRMLSELSRDEPQLTDNMRIEIFCTIKARTKPLKLIVFVIVAGINQHPPVFIKDSTTSDPSFCYETTVSEMSGVGSLVLDRIRAKDADRPMQRLMYRVNTTVFDHEYFDINTPETGKLTLKKQVDFETTPTLKVSVTAEDWDDQSSESGFVTSCTVHVTVTDGDDQAPVFTHSVYRATVLINATAGTPVTLDFPVLAEDPDTHVIEDVEYSIVKGNTQGLFQIDRSTGVISLAPSIINLQPGQEYSLVIQATQVTNKQQSGVAVVLVAIQSTNYSGPRFANSFYTRSISEDAANGTTVMTLSAKFGSIIRYSIRENITEFSIDPESGEITVADRLDYEQTTSYTFHVVADDGTYSSETEVLVNITNINDNNPVFLQSSYDFGKVSTNVNTIIGVVQARDADADTMLTYDLRQHTDLFRITPNGELSLISTDARGLQDAYSILIHVVDNGQPPRESSVRVNFRFRDDPSTAESGSGSENIVLVAALGAVGALLLLLVIILIIYVTKIRKRKQRKRKHIQNKPLHAVVPNAYESQIALTGDPNAEPIDAKMSIKASGVSSRFFYENSINSRATTPQSEVSSICTGRLSAYPVPIATPTVKPNNSSELRVTAGASGGESQSVVSSFDNSDVPIDHDSSMSQRITPLISSNPLPNRTHVTRSASDSLYSKPVSEEKLLLKQLSQQLVTSEQSTVFEGDVPNGNIKGTVSPGGSIRAVLSASGNGGMKQQSALITSQVRTPNLLGSLQGVFIPIQNLQQNGDLNLLTKKDSNRSSSQSSDDGEFSHRGSRRLQRTSRGQPRASYSAKHTNYSTAHSAIPEGRETEAVTVYF